MRASLLYGLIIAPERRSGAGPKGKAVILSGKLAAKECILKENERGVTADGKDG
jgi:hypothetical protein